jgi:transposase
MSTWVSRLLRELGHEVVVVSPRRVRLIAESSLKTDRIDAEVLARLSCFGRGLLQPVYERREAARLLQTRLGVRTTLVRSKVSMVNSVKGTLRSLGYRLRGQAVGRLVASYGALELPVEIRRALDPLVETIVELADRIDELTAELRSESRDDELLQRLQTVPGVGPIVSLAFVSFIDDPTRFRRSRDVGAYVGLRPRVRSSGGVERRGSITREGNPEMRRLLVQAAHQLLRSRKESALKQWASQIDARAGKKRAVVALARKLAVLLHHLWVTGQRFEAFPSAAA